MANYVYKVAKTVPIVYGTACHEFNHKLFWPLLLLKAYLFNSPSFPV